MPSRAGLDEPVRQVSCGASHTCGLTKYNVAYCLGHGFQGQLGNGQTAGTTAPVLMLGQR
jgi:alpha-tubulin suppressor-like RCC1 family protein